MPDRIDYGALMEEVVRLSENRLGHTRSCPRDVNALVYNDPECCCNRAEFGAALLVLEKAAARYREAAGKAVMHQCQGECGSLYGRTNATQCIGCGGRIDPLFAVPVGGQAKLEALNALEQAVAEGHDKALETKLAALREAWANAHTRAVACRKCGSTTLCHHRAGSEILIAREAIAPAIEDLLR